MRVFASLLLLSLGIALLPGRCLAGQTYLRSAGVNYGISATDSENYFHLYQASAVLQLPWELRNRNGWGVSTQVDAAAGMLRGEGYGGFLGSAGPAFSFGKPGFPLEMDLGVSAAILARSKFGNKDLNGPVEFISHVGLDYRLCKKVGLEYRFQHISNAGLNGGPNPGLNLHLVGVNWYFDH